MTVLSHWLCTTCQKRYDAEPLKCACGGREFACVNVQATGLGFKVEAELVERKR